VFNRLALLLGVLLVSAAAAGPVGAYTLSSDEGRFSIEMPDKPDFKVRRITGTDGTVLESNEWIVDQPWILWQVSYRDHPPTAASALPEKIFDRVIHELPDLLDGELRSHRFIEHDGVRGLEVRIFVPKNRLLLRSHVFVVRHRQYAISYVGPDGSENAPKVDNYLNSFHVLP